MNIAHNFPFLFKKKNTHAILLFH